MRLKLRQGLYDAVAAVTGWSKEDYGPDWLTVAELERGTFENEGRPGVVFAAKPVTGRRRDEVWQRFGPP